MFGLAFVSIKKAVLTVAILTAVVTASAKGRPYYGPISLGPFRIDRNVSMQSLFDRLGVPSKKARDSFCYRSASDDAFLVLTRMAEVYGESVAGQVTISDFPNCFDLPVQVTNDDLAGWKTGKGIGLGSSRQAVITAYGKPSEISVTKGNVFRWVIHGSSPGLPSIARSKIGDSALSYRSDDDLKTTSFGIRANRVVWISMSDSE